MALVSCPCCVGVFYLDYPVVSLSSPDVYASLYYTSHGNPTPVYGRFRRRRYSARHLCRVGDENKKDLRLTPVYGRSRWIGFSQRKRLMPLEEARKRASRVERQFR
jgi:hypothetical protein